MPSAVFLYVYPTKTVRETANNGTVTDKRVLVTKKGLPDPARLVSCGFVPTITRRNVSFRAIFEFPKGELTGRAVKKIQKLLDIELDNIIISSYRVWKKSMAGIPVNQRDTYMRQIGERVSIAVAKYEEFIRTGTIANQPIPPSNYEMNVTNVAVAIHDAAEEVELKPEERDALVADVLSQGEGSFIASQGEGDELADLLSGLVFQQTGGKKRRRTRKA
jgi:hypothetical protein